MKLVKRIIVVVLLALTAITVGYLIYTGSRFSLLEGANETAKILKEVSVWKSA